MYFFKKILSTTVTLLILILSVAPNISLAQERPSPNRHGHFPFSPEMMEESEESQIRTNDTEIITPIEETTKNQPVFVENYSETKKETQIDSITRNIQSTPQSTPSGQTDETVWDTQEDFNKGQNDNTSTNNFTGDVTLQYQNPGESYTETTKEEFDLGRDDVTQLYTSAVDNQDDGEVIINQGWRYNTDASPIIGHDKTSHSFFDDVHNLLYISTLGGLSVINTQGTIDSSDDVLIITYTTTSSPAIVDDVVYHSFLDEVNNLLYISTWNGVSVININDPLNASDDVLVTIYDTTSSPAIVHDVVYHSFLDTVNNLLYISTWGGVSVININDALNPLDDVLFTTYTTPMIANNIVKHSFLDEVNNLLYISTWNGISVININDPLNPLDDVLFTTYNTTSTPAIASNHISSSFLDAVNNLVYINAYGGGLSVINRHSVPNPLDDTLVITYNTTSIPTIVDNDIHHSFLDPTSNLLYISAYGGGVTVINTHNTENPLDDTIAASYNETSVPTIISQKCTHSSLDLENNLLYITAGDGFSVIDLNNKYSKKGVHISKPQQISNTPTEQLIWDQLIVNEHVVNLQYRTGDTNAVWRNDFDDDNPSEYAGDYYGWGNEFQDAIESDGTMKLSNPNPYISGDNSWADSWIDTGKPDGYFPVGSLVKARVRVNSEREKGVYEDYIFSDDWWDEDDFWINNEWHVFNFRATEPFSKIGFDTGWKTGTWNNTTDSLEIDYIQIELPDSHWNEWSDECTDNTNCQIDQSALTGNEYIQYKLNLETSDTTTTPRVNSVTYANNYQNTGTYTSNKINFTETTYLNTFNVEQTIPDNTNITYEYSIDNGNTWNTINQNENFPTNTKTNNFQWKAFFTSTNTKTPQIQKVTLNSDKANTTKEVIETIPECECYELNSTNIPDNATISYSDNNKQDFNYTPQPDSSNKDCDITDIKITYNNTTSITGEDTIQEFVGNFTDTRIIDEGNGKVVLDGTDFGTYTTGGTDWDGTEDIVIDSQDNIYTTGWFDSTDIDFDPTPGVDIQPTHGDYDAFLTKINADGSYGYTYIFGGTDSDGGYGIAVDLQDNIYITGEFEGLDVDFDPTSGTDLHSSNGGQDIFLTKINADGSYEYTYTMGSNISSGYETGYGIVVDAINNVYVSGSFYGIDVDFDPTSGIDPHSSNGGADIFFTKFNADGSYGYTYTMGGTGDDWGDYAVVNTHNNIYITSNFRGIDIDFDPTSGTDLHSSNGGADIALTKINADGSYGYTYTIGGSVTDNVWGFAIDSQNNIYITGNFGGVDVDFNPTSGTDFHSSNGSQDIFLTKINADGSYGFTYTMGGNSSAWDSGSGIAIDSNNNVYLTGEFAGTSIDFDPTSGTDLHSATGYADIFFTKFNADGSYGYTYTMGGTGGDWGWGDVMAVNSHDNIYNTGYFEGANIDFDPTINSEIHPSNGMGDIFLTKYNVDGTYGTLSTTHNPNGTYQTKVNSQGTLEQWQELNITREQESDTTLTYEVLDESCTNTLITETNNTTIDLSGIDISNTELCLKTNFTTSDELKTPKLDKWEVMYVAETNNTDTTFTYKTQEDPKCEKIDECKFDKVKNITENSVDLRVEVDKKYNDKQKFKVEVENQDTGEKETIKIKDTPSDNGMVTLTIDQLIENTNYRIKARFKGDDKDDYEHCPHSKTITTEKSQIVGPVQPIEEDSTPIKDTTIEENPTEETTEEQEDKTTVPPVQGGTLTPPTPPGLAANEPNIIIPATLGLAAIALASIPLFPLPLQTSLLMLFAIPFIKRKKEKFWGVVFDSHTKQPLKNVVVSLIDTNSNEKIETVLTDDHGRYGFLISKQANYELTIKKGSYTINTKNNNDTIYGKLYTEPQDFEPDTPIELNIALEQQEVNWDTYIQGISKKVLLKTFFNIFLYIVFIGGFLYSIYTTINYPHWINYIVIAIYAITTIFLIIKKTRKHYGTVTSKETKSPIPFTLIELYQNNQRVHFTVTDIQGRYYLLTEDGTYTMKVKGQPAGGHIFEKHGDINVTKGIVKEDIEI